MTQVRQARLEGTALDMAMALKMRIEANNARMMEIQADSQENARFTMGAILNVLGIRGKPENFVFDMGYLEQCGLVFISGVEDAVVEDTQLQAFFSRLVEPTSDGPKGTQ